MILSIEGEEATAKTTTAYTAPLPIVGFSFDIGSKRAIYGSKYTDYFDGLKIEFLKYSRGMAPVQDGWQFNDITIFEIPQPIQLENTKLIGFLELWDFFINTLVNVIEDENVRTIVIDTMTLARRHKADAYMQELQAKNPGRKQLLQIEYGHVNDSIRNIYNIMSTRERNLVALHHLTDERTDVQVGNELQQRLTGNRILEGLAQTYRYVDVALRMSKDPRAKGIVGEIKKCGYNLSLESQPVLNPTWDKLVDMIEMSLGGRFKFDRRSTEAAGK